MPLPPPAATQIDVVGIFDQNFNQVFPEARPIKAVVKPLAEAMDHPLENSASTVDHIVFKPIEIEMSLIIQVDDASDLPDVYNTIFQFYSNATLLNVHTRAKVFPNQFIYEMPHEESPDQIDTLVLAVKFKQAQFANTQVTTTTVQPANPANSDAVDRGVVQPKPAKRSTLSIIGYPNG